MRLNTFKITLNGDLSLYRKLLLRGSYINPRIMTKLETIRCKNISASSVD
jgi:hypothetical protein